MVKISSIPSVQSVIKLIAQYGISDAILSPGSRNAPLIISFSAVKEINCENIVDERVAAFVALGMAQQSQKPVIICCTSGSAMLNYAPAIAEAYYQNVPLIVLTADRPKQWIDRGEGQSIRQMEVISGIVSKQVEWDHNKSIAENELKVSATLEHAISSFSPAHINMPLEEPLYEVEESRIEFKDFEPIINTSIESEPAGFSKAVSEAERIMIVCAQMNGIDDCSEQIRKLSEDPRVAILTETTANLYQLGYVSCIDRTLATFYSDDISFVPDLIVTIGENIISKRLKQFLRGHKDRVSSHWHFGLKSMPVFDIAEYHFSQNARSALMNIEKTDRLIEQPFANIWKHAFFKSEDSHLKVISELPYSDLKVFEMIVDYIPDGWQIQMGNSSVVRYFQLFNQLPKNTYFGNRGVSGIDGCTSTAVGAAKRVESPVLFVSGDHAFRYDANALSTSNIPPSLKMIVINNEGGNIFRIINGPQGQVSSEAHIEHHAVKSVKGLVEYHGVQYRSATDIDSLERELMSLFDESSQCAKVLEVFTPRTESPEVLARYFDSM